MILLFQVQALLVQHWRAFLAGIIKYWYLREGKQNQGFSTGPKVCGGLIAPDAQKALGSMGTWYSPVCFIRAPALWGSHN
jgi:hypothetical protein